MKDVFDQLVSRLRCARWGVCVCIYTLVAMEATTAFLGSVSRNAFSSRGSGVPLCVFASASRLVARREASSRFSDTGQRTGHFLLHSRGLMFLFAFFFLFFFTFLM